MADNFSAFNSRQLQHVADTSSPERSGLIIDTLPLCLVNDVAQGFDGSSFTVQHPLTNYAELDAGSILAYGETPSMEGDKHRASATIKAYRRSTRALPFVRGFNNDPHRLQRLMSGGSHKISEILDICERIGAQTLFDGSVFTPVDIAAGAGTLANLSQAANVFMTVFNYLRQNQYYRYRGLMGASLECWIFEEDIPVFGEFLELTGILGRESGTGVRLNPGLQNDDQIVAALRSRLRLDAVHVIKHAPNTGLVNGPTVGLANPTEDSSGASYSNTAMHIALVDRAASVYDLRHDSGLIVKPRFGPVVSTAGNALAPELRNKLDDPGRIETVWAEMSFGMANVTAQLKTSNSAFNDLPGGVIFHNINPV